VPHEPCVTLVEYDMCSLLLFPPQQMEIGMMIIVMSTSLGVNQSTTSLCLEFLLEICY
jgi:hypothetical protein